MNTRPSRNRIHEYSGRTALTCLLAVPARLPGGRRRPLKHMVPISTAGHWRARAVRATPLTASITKAVCPVPPSATPFVPRPSASVPRTSNCTDQSVAFPATAGQSDWDMGSATLNEQGEVRSKGNFSFARSRPTSAKIVHLIDVLSYCFYAPFFLSSSTTEEDNSIL